MTQERYFYELHYFCAKREFDEKEPKNQGCIQILRFCYPFRRVRTQTRPACVGAQTWVLSADSKGAKPGFE
jgi:hypothetical protein